MAIAIALAILSGRTLIRPNRKAQLYRMANNGNERPQNGLLEPVFQPILGIIIANPNQVLLIFTSQQAGIFEPRVKRSLGHLQLEFTECSFPCVLWRHNSPFYAIEPK